MDPITRTMKLNRITKGAARFEEVLGDGEAEVLGSIYLKKWPLGAKVAAMPLAKEIIDSDVTIKVTVTIPEAQ